MISMGLLTAFMDSGNLLQQFGHLTCAGGEGRPADDERQSRPG